MKLLRRAALLPLPALLLLLCSPAPAGATLLRALVAEVPDGATLVVVSSNRKLTVVLKGVESPRDAREAEQARRHLSALALGREVTIEYTGLRGRHIYGRALCGAMDLGLQLVRDGAARYDGSAENTLGGAERQIYAESERAARAERRGVWQAAGAPALGGAAQFALTTAVSVAPESERRRAPRSLNTEDLLVRRAAERASAAGAQRPAGGALPPKVANWPLNRPGEDLDFSPYLGRGRKTLVYFYADWCPACRATSPVMRQINGTYDDLELLPLDIARWGSPVAARHNVGFVPYLQIYDEGGSLVAEGDRAADWITSEVRRRNAPAGAGR